MKKLLILVILLSSNLYDTHAQTEVSGTIVSVNGKPIPLVSVEVESNGPGNIFTLPGKSFADDNGEFSIIFKEPGIYTLTIRGVFHKSVRIPIMIYDQDRVSMTISLLPDSYNDGEYFDQQVYLEWIRVYGNFNDYDYFSGEIFRANSDGSISAFIKSELDTIRYQIRGLTSGVAVLPYADDYAPRDSDFEALLFNASNTDSVELRFHPDEKQPYSHVLPEGPASWQVELDAFVHFYRETDKYWSLPLKRVRSSWITYQTLSDAPNPGVPNKILREAMFRRSEFGSTREMISFRDSIARDLRRNDLHPQQRSALLISYVGLISQQKTMEQYLRRTDQETPGLKVHSNVFDSIFKTVDPRNPVWALNSEAPLILLDETDYSDDAVSYTEQMIRQHASEMVVRKLVLRLIEKSAHDFRDITDMPYYDWIVQRYGENNLARKAVLAFQKANQSR